LSCIFFSSKVALADKSFKDEERKFIQNLEGIEYLKDFTMPKNEPSTKTLAQLINKKYKPHHKIDLINTLFAMAEADGTLHDEEVNLIKIISEFLEIPDYKFEEIKGISAANIAERKSKEEEARLESIRVEEERRRKEEAAILEEQAMDEEFSDIDFDDDE